MFLPLLLAQSPSASGVSPNPIVAMLPMLMMMLVLYLLLIQPQRKRQRQLEKMVENVKKGDKVVAAGGLIGTVLAPPNKEGIIVLKIGQDTKVEVLKSSISQVYT